MNSIEIVGAIIDDRSVTSDCCAIDASTVLGRRVEYVSRAEARQLAENHPMSPWQRLVDAPTIFIYRSGMRYRLLQRRQTNKGTENGLESTVSSSLSGAEYTSFKQIGFGTNGHRE